MTLFMRDKLQDIFQATGTTMILVSHDLDEAVYLGDEILMLTRRPTRIAERVVFDAPRPRTPATLTSEAFTRAKARCLDVFQREVSARELAL
jgi:NitT/TauT family transport system ATP-binding protein